MVPFVLSSSPEQIAVQNRAATRLSRVPITPALRPQREKAGDQHVGQLGGFRDLSVAQPQWSHPNKDVTLLSIAGNARFAALIAGSVDATVVNSPFEYRAEQKGFEVLLSIKETAEFVKIPINGLGTSQRKIDREPDEVVRMLGALPATRICFCKISARSAPG